MIATIRKLEEEQKQLKKVLEQYRDSDPDAIAQERQDIKVSLCLCILCL